MSIMRNINTHTYLVAMMALACAAACSGDQFVGWQQETFDQTKITETVSREIVIGNTEEMEEQHIRGINFDKGSNARSEERRVGKECRSRWSPYH